jgi:hypothetical protein
MVAFIIIKIMLSKFARQRNILSKKFLRAFSEGGNKNLPQTTVEETQTD